MLFAKLLMIIVVVYCLQIYGAQFMETSAKTGFNVGNCLMNLVR